MLAVMNDHVDVINVLCMTEGVRFDLKDAEGKGVLDYAKPGSA